IETVAPDAPVIGDFAGDSGATGDFLTNDPTLHLTGTAAASAVVEIFDGSTSLGTATAGTDGAWVFDTNALGDGPHSLTAVATDEAGNASAASSTLTVTVDTEAPGQPSITDFGDDTGISGDFRTKDATLHLAGSAEAGATVEVFDGGNSL